MQIQQQMIDTTTVVALQGDFDAAAAPEVEKRLLALAQSNQPRLVVDMNSVPYIASAGLRVLLAAVKTARAGGGDLRLVGLQPAVKHVFDMAGFALLFKTFASVKIGIAHV